MTRLMLVRHGDVDADMSRYWGHTDVPLSAEGLKQAGNLCRRLAKEKVDAVYSSDLRRAVDTAAVIAMPHRLPVVPCPELREINFGRCEGMTFGEVKEHYPEAEKLWLGADPELSFPGGESLGTLAERVETFAARLRHHKADTVLVVAHGGPLRVLICRLTGLDLSCWQQIQIERASLSIMEIDACGKVIHFLNDVSHLQRRQEIE